MSVKAATASVKAGGRESYTATVTPAPTSGTVTFSDGESPIEGCGSVALQAGSATCAVTYTAAGAHAVTASYSGSEDHILLPSSAASPAGVYVEAAAVAAPQETKTAAPSSDPPAKAPLLISHGTVPVLTEHKLSLKVRCGSAGCKVRPNVWITIAGRSWQLPAVVSPGAPGYADLTVTVPRTARRGLRAVMRAHPRWHAFVNVLLGEPSSAGALQLTSMGQLHVSRPPS